MKLMMPVRVVGTKMLVHSPIAGVEDSKHRFGCSPEVQKELADSCCFVLRL